MYFLTRSSPKTMLSTRPAFSAMSSKYAGDKVVAWAEACGAGACGGGACLAMAPMAHRATARHRRTPPYTTGRAEKFTQCICSQLYICIGRQRGTRGKSFGIELRRVGLLMQPDSGRRVSSCLVLLPILLLLSSSALRGQTSRPAPTRTDPGAPAADRLQRLYQRAIAAIKEDRPAEARADLESLLKVNPK